MNSEKLTVVFAASEAAPFAKTGGLADVVGALPRTLARLGHRVALLLPCHRMVRERGFSAADTGLRLQVPLGDRTLRAALRHLDHQGLDVWLIDLPEFFDREGLYGIDGIDHADNGERYGFFCHAVLQALRVLNLRPDILHLHDWQTGLVPLLLDRDKNRDSFFARTGSLLTIHNLAYQGLFSPDLVEGLHLPPELFSIDGFEYWGKLSFLKAGVQFADRINTVSPTYAAEILTPEFGCGFEGILTQRKDRLSGILNGIDPDDWNPAVDPCLPVNYDSGNLAGKARCKSELQRELGLEVDSDIPLLAMVTRIDRQKGIDLVLAAWQALADTPLQLAFLGSGDAALAAELRELETGWPRKVAVRIGFDDALSRRIYGGADLFLMPSRFEPCGLGQLIALRYGTVPVVRRTGGLADTIVDFARDTENGCGYLFDAPDVSQLVQVLNRAVGHFHQHQSWQRRVASCMQRDYSWRQSARHYAALYHTILGEMP
ncbi:MAG: glycogen synthase GlgA [Geothermobacteraceae bacterium]